MNGAIPSRISTSTPLILMISMYFLCWTCVWMNSFGMSTNATSLHSSASMMHVSSTDYVETVGELASSLEIKSIYFLSPYTVLPLMVPSLLSFRNIWDSSIYFLWSYDMFFQCSRRKVYLIYICFISEWIASLPLLTHILRPALSASWVTTDPTTSGSCIVITWLQNMWYYGYNIPMFYICVSSYEYLFPDRMVD